MLYLILIYVLVMVAWIVFRCVEAIRYRKAINWDKAKIFFLLNITVSALVWPIDMPYTLYKMWYYKKHPLIGYLEMADFIKKD